LHSKLKIMATKTWALDPTHSEVQFKIKHLMITNVTGSFNIFTVSAQTEDEDFTKAKLSFTADVNSISTNNEQRDAHLKGADFFDAEKFPEIKFTATKSENVDSDGSYELYGDLTIRDVTKNVKLSVEFGGVVKDPWGNTKAGFTINGKINRKDFGLTWNAVTEAGGVMVSEEVRLSAEIQLIEQA
jgi:polyisoprenoid-binding protein YceI